MLNTPLSGCRPAGLIALLCAALVSGCAAVGPDYAEPQLPVPAGWTAAADRLAADGIEAEVVDLRTLAPLDTATLLASVRRTGRLVVRMKAGAGFGAGCQHSHNLEAWLAHCPGLKVVMPSTPADAKGLLKSAIRDPNPVAMLEDMLLYFQPGPVPEGEYLTPIGRAEIKRPGRDVTVVTWSKMVGVALRAADQLAADGIEVEVVDLRTLAPLDTATLLASVRRTGRLVVLHEANRTGGFAGEIAAVVMEEALDSLKAPLRRVCGPDIPVPASPPLERWYIPNEERLMAAVRDIV